MTDPIDRVMVQSISEIGSVMGKKTIAEFVENDEVLHILKDMGVDYAQGYGIGKPMPFIDIIQNKLITNQIHRKSIVKQQHGYPVQLGLVNNSV